MSRSQRNVNAARHAAAAKIAKVGKPQVKEAEVVIEAVAPAPVQKQEKDLDLETSVSPEISSEPELVAKAAEMVQVLKSVEDAPKEVRSETWRQVISNLHGVPVEKTEVLADEDGMYVTRLTCAEGKTVVLVNGLPENVYRAALATNAGTMPRLGCQVVGAFLVAAIARHFIIKGVTALAEAGMVSFPGAIVLVPVVAGVLGSAAAAVGFKAGGAAHDLVRPKKNNGAEERLNAIIAA